MEIGAARDVGRGNALLDARGDALAKQVLLARREPRIGEGVEIIHRQMKAFEDEERRFIQRIRRPMAMVQVRLPEGADGITQAIAQGFQFGDFRARVRLGHGFCVPTRRRSPGRRSAGIGRES